MAQSKKDRGRTERDPEGRLHRVGQRLRDLSLLVKSVVTLVIVIVLLATAAFGLGTVRVSSRGIEFPVQETASGEAVGTEQPEQRGASGQGDIYFLLKPQVVRICPR